MIALVVCAVTVLLCWLGGIVLDYIDEGTD
jgi:hypothetical protein